jgi:protein TonB
MSIRKLIVASAFSVSSVSLLLSSPAWADANGEPHKSGQCEARLVQAQTNFPKAAQDRGESGTVRVQVVLNKEGRVVESRVAASSGSSTLDRAAEKSVSTDWQFDVSHCVASALPVTQEVNVVYRPVPKSFSASVSQRGRQFVKQASANDQCAVVPMDSGRHVVSCIQRATPGGVGATDLASDAR